MDGVSSHQWDKVRTIYKDICRGQHRRCWLCGDVIDYDASKEDPNAFQPDHYHPRKTHPHLALELSNLRPSHALCNQKRGATADSSEPWVRAEEW